MKTKLGRIQRKVMEIGMIGRLAHNLAKYRAGIDGAYTEGEFLFITRNCFMRHGVKPELISEWVRLVEIQAEQEVKFFLTHGEFSESSGGTAIHVDMLIGPILNELGYEVK